MHRLFLLFLLLSGAAHAQVWPADSSALNYRIIGFSFPGNKQADSFVLQVAVGDYENEAEFEQHVFASFSCKTNREIAEVPYWNSDYTWRILYFMSGSKQVDSTLHHFRTKGSYSTDTDLWRLHIDTPARKFADCYVFVDATKTLYDMAGHPVWYLPENEIVKDNLVMRDLKETPDGTVTVLSGPSKSEALTGCECNYDGKVLWKAPKNGAESGGDHYNHELTKLKNGHYMILGNEVRQLEWEYFSPGDSGLYIVGTVNKPVVKPPVQFKVAPFGTLVEYDSKGTPVWWWRSVDYYKGKDLKSHVLYDGDHSNIAGRPPAHRAQPKPAPPPKGSLVKPRAAYNTDSMDDHVNSFFFDSVHRVVYINFKNVEHILKISYPDGKVLADYSGDDKAHGSLFCDEHAVTLSHAGQICVYNNNDCHPRQPPNLVILQQPRAGESALKVVWKYALPWDASTRAADNRHTSGGNIQELPGGNWFISMSEPRMLLIVGPNGRILWQGDAELSLRNGEIWHKLSTYRSSLITPEELKKMIWYGKP
jgi:hypothetical protein